MRVGCSRSRIAAVVFAAVLATASQGAVPTKVRAIPGDGIVSLVWSRGAEATTYNIYRSTTSGATGATPLRTNHAAAPPPHKFGQPDKPGADFLVDFADSTVTNGTAYYYQITELTGGTESAKSVQVQAAPAASSGGITKSRFLKILPLGNSITEGWCGQDRGGYRMALYDSLKAGGYQFLLAGSHTSLSDNMWEQRYPGTNVIYNDPYHEGWGNRKVGELLHGVVDRALRTFDPDIVLLEIGTNDFAWYYDQSTMGNTLKAFDTLLSTVFALKPDIFLLVAPIPPIYGSTEITGVYNAGVKSRVETWAGKGKHAHYISDMESILTDCDGVHPSESQYVRMGGFWYSAIKAITSTTAARGRHARGSCRGPVVSSGRSGVTATSAPGSRAGARILDGNGRVVAAYEGAGGKAWNVAGLKPGAYFLAATAGSRCHAERIVVLR